MQGSEHNQQLELRVEPRLVLGDEYAALAWVELPVFHTLVLDRVRRGLLLLEGLLRAVLP